MNKILKNQYHKAKEEGRICSNCGWMITKKDWKSGHRMCFNCRNAKNGVNISYGHGPYQEEIIDRTGEMD